MSLMDFTGRPIEAGMTVAYPVRRRSLMWMEVLAVQQIDEPKSKLSGFNRDGRRVNITNVKNCVIIQPLEMEQARTAEYRPLKTEQLEAVA